MPAKTKPPAPPKPSNGHGAGKSRASRGPDPGAAPSHLSEGSRSLWDRLVRDYDMADDLAGLAILASALEARDRAEMARERIALEGMILKDRVGGAKSHPLLTVERDSRAAFLSAMKALRLDIEPNHSSPGRPPGRGY